MRVLKAALAMAIMAATGGCAALNGNGNGDMQAEQIYADGLCGRTKADAAARWINSAEELEIIRQQFGQFRMGPPTFPAVDFDERGVLLVQMGKRRTAGFGLGLAESGATLSDGVARVNLEWRKPAKDALTAQVLTSPCVMITLPKAGIERIRVLDQTGATRLSLTPQ